MLEPRLPLAVCRSLFGVLKSSLGLGFLMPLIPLIDFHNNSAIVSVTSVIPQVAGGIKPHGPKIKKEQLDLVEVAVSLILMIRRRKTMIRQRRKARAKLTMRLNMNKSDEKNE